MEETRRPSETLNSRPNTDDRMIDLTRYGAALEADLFALRERLSGEVKRLDTLHAGVIREVDNARQSHDALHQIDRDSVATAREAQEHRNKALNDERTRQSSRDDKFAQKETVDTQIVALQRAVDANVNRIRELELAQKATSAERAGGKDNQASIIGLVFLAIAVIGLVVTLANVLT